MFRLFAPIMMLCHRCCFGYVPPEVRQRWKDRGFADVLEESVQMVQDCAQRGKNTQPDPTELFWAVKFIDRNGIRIYKEDKQKKDLLEKSEGSWELRLAVNSDRDRQWYPHPEFRAFAMAFITIEKEYFGKGIASDPNFSFVALGGPSSRNIPTRQVYMNYEEFFINGRQVPGWDLSYFMRGYARNWVATERKRPPLAFTVVYANDNILIVRGNKTGGMAIFRRIQADMRPAAYGY